MSTGPDNPNFNPPPPGGYYQGPAPDNYGLANQVAAQEKVQLPATFLIVVGVLNLLLALYLVFNAFTLGMMTLEQFQEQMQTQQEMLRRTFPEAADQMARRDPASFKALLLVWSSIWAGLSLLAALLVLMAGIEMRALRYYGVAVIGSLVAAVPCVSCVGCCGLGEIVGIWALVVLLNQDVRAAFR